MPAAPTTTPATGPATDPAFRRRRRAGTVLGAAAAGLGVWAVAVPLSGFDLLVQTGADAAVRTVGPVDVVLAALASGAAGWALLALLERVAPARARTVWTGIALAVLVLSVPSALGAALGAGSVAILTALHVAVGTAVVTGLRRSTPRRDTPRVASAPRDGEAGADDALSAAPGTRAGWPR